MVTKRTDHSTIQISAFYHTTHLDAIWLTQRTSIISLNSVKLLASTAHRNALSGVGNQSFTYNANERRKMVHHPGMVAKPTNAH
jgi:hypothetical protein